MTAEPSTPEEWSRRGLEAFRSGRTAEALRLWTDVLTDPDAAPVGLLVDLAKLEEHHARDLPAALRLARLGLARAEQDGGDEGRPLLVEALAHRVRRLERRVARYGTQESSFGNTGFRGVAETRAALSRLVSARTGQSCSRALAPWPRPEQR